jgi:transposase InsO family protein
MLTAEPGAKRLCGLPIAFRLAHRAGSTRSTCLAKIYRTRDEARADVFDYIERFYNAKRRHSTIGYLRPMQYERQTAFA